MPFGVKLDPTARVEIDFDSVYAKAILPAAEAAELDVIRADEELEGGLIHVGMFERLLLAEIVVADLTALNPNVFYELGIRHAARPRTTIPIFARMTRLPFDVAPIRALPYDLEEGSLTDSAAESLRAELHERLERAREASETHDSPLFQLIRDYRGIELAHEVTETFRDRVHQITELRERIAELRGDEERLGELRELRESLTPFATAPAELLLDLLLAFRAVGAWDDIIAYVAELPTEVREHVTVQEQLAQALGRRNEGDDRRRAIEILNAVTGRYGPSAETSGILGGIFKREFEDLAAAGRSVAAAAALDAAIDAYSDGFEADPRDAYPGINLLTLLVRRGGDGDARRVGELAPVVAFALSRRGIDRSNDYWDVATALELAVHMGDWDSARRMLGRLRLVAAESWMLESTATNLDILASAFERRDGAVPGELGALVAGLRELAANC